MSKHQLINRRGEAVTLELEDDAAIPDGYGIRAPMFLMDSVQRAIATNVHDAWGGDAGHRPGYVFTNTRDAMHVAREEYIARLQDAWKTPTVAVPVSDQRLLDPRRTSDHNRNAALAEYEARISNAWRKP